MPIDTSSYYPEVEGPEGKGDGYSLNKRKTGLFGNDAPEKEDVDKVEEVVEVVEPLKSESEELETSDNVSENEPEVPKGDLEKCVDIFSNFLSWALVPLLIPIYGVIFIFTLTMLEFVPTSTKLSFIFITAGINFVIPMLLIFLMKFMGIIEDVGLNGRKERLIPYVITALCFGATAWFMGVRGAPLWVPMFFAGGALAAIVNLAINFKWKISAHAAAIAGLIALLIRMEQLTITEPKLFTWLLITILAAGLLGSARVWLGRHTVWQVLAGYTVGFCCVFFLMAI